MALPHHRTSRVGLGIALAGALVLSACASAADESVSVGSSRLGSILVDAHGHALYTFASDKPDRSTCVAACARVWPPATTRSRPTAAGPVAQKDLGTIARADHTLQLTYDTHPLYTFSGDAANGQINGEGFLGSWFVLDPRGRKVVDPKVPAPPPGY